MARRMVFRSVLAVSMGSLVAACYWITPYSDLTSADGDDAAGDAGGAPDARGVVDASDASEAAPADPSLIGHWTFEADDNGIARDLSDAGNDLLLEDTVVGAPGHDSGSALHYPDGNGMAHCDALNMGFPPAGTLSVWAFFPPPATDEQRDIFDVYDQDRHHIYVRYSPGNGDAAAQPLDFVSQINSGFDFFANPSPIVPTGVWTHLVMTWDRTALPMNNAQFYVDGAHLAGAVFVPAADVPIIQHFELYNGYAGAYDDLSLWNRSFSEEEVREIP